MVGQEILKIYVESPGFEVGCCPVVYGEEEMASFPGAKQRKEVARLLVRLRERFGESLRVDLIDPRSLLALVAHVRFHLRGNDVTWVWRGRVLYRGIPSWSELEQALTGLGDERI